MAAAAVLSDAGVDVTLVERRPRLGGRATSFDDPATGLLLDNCQHVLLGCCTRLLSLYKRMGVEPAIERFERIMFADAAGRRASLAAGPLPSPLHLAGAMLRFSLLTLAEKLDIARAMAAMKLAGETGALSAGRIPFSQWLIDHQQSPSTIARFWDVIVVSALNARCDQASARYGMQVFQEAFLGDRQGYVLGVPRVPLAELYEKAVARRVITNTRVTELQVDHDRAAIMLADGQRIDGDAVIVATAPDSARRLLSPLPPMAGTIEKLSHLRYHTILGVHLFFDRPVMAEPHLALIGTELQWLFRKDSEGRHVHGVISAAQEQTDEGSAQLEQRLVGEVRRLLPEAENARLTSIRVVREKRATFVPSPGVDDLRPQQATAMRRLFLAGDYTQTGWPATMEGAVRSGEMAAEAVLKAL